MALLEAMMDGTLHIDGRVSDAMVVRAMRAVAIDGLGMPADHIRHTRVPQVLVDLLREHPCPHGHGNISLPFGFSVCGCCLDPCMNTPARLMMAHVDVEGAKRYVLSSTDDAIVERNGSTLLSLAINNAKPEFCEWLLTDVHVDAAYKAQALVSAPDQFGMTPLMKAAHKGYLPVVIAILAIVDVENVIAVDEDGFSALSNAADAGWHKVIKTLLKYLKSRLSQEEFLAHVNLANKNGETALCRATLTHTPDGPAQKPPGGADLCVSVLAAAGAEFTRHCRRTHPACKAMMCSDKRCRKVCDLPSRREMKENIPCASCGARGAKHKCSGCKLVSYCNRSCQKKHWKAHKAACREANDPNTGLRVISALDKGWRPISDAADGPLAR